MALETSPNLILLLLLELDFKRRHVKDVDVDDDAEAIRSNTFKRRSVEHNKVEDNEDDMVGDEGLLGPHDLGQVTRTPINYTLIFFKKHWNGLMSFGLFWVKYDTCFS